MRKILICLSLLCLLPIALNAQSVTVKLKPDEDFSNKQIVSVMERNLSKVLTEINAAQKDKRPLNLNDMPMSDFAKNGLRMLWANIYFYCDDEYVVDRLWNFSDSYMARSIPIIIIQLKNFPNLSYLLI